MVICAISCDDQAIIVWLLAHNLILQGLEQLYCLHINIKAKALKG